MENAQLRMLAVWRLWRHAKPNVVVIELKGFAEIKFGGIAQAGLGKCVGLGGKNGEFPRVELVGFLAGAIGNPNNRFGVCITDSDDQRWPGFWGLARAR